MVQAGVASQVNDERFQHQAVLNHGAGGRREPSDYRPFLPAAPRHSDTWDLS